MPYRKIILTNDEIYHIINRGVAQTPIYTSSREKERFLILLDYYRLFPSLSFSHYNRLSKNEKREYLNNLKSKNKPIIEIYSYCLMPNHFHLLLKQLDEKGISKYLSNVQNAYVKYFNTRHDRKGPLFESVFNAVRIETEEQFLHVSRYIHLNPYTSYLIKLEKLVSYPWSSLPDYLSNKSILSVNTSKILKLINGKLKYKQFVFNQADYQRRLAKIKHLVLE